VDSIYSVEIEDYIYNDEYDSYNNKKVISQRIEYYKNKNELTISPVVSAYSNWHNNIISHINCDVAIDTSCSIINSDFFITQV
jgi:hypothetical protein